MRPKPVRAAIIMFGCLGFAYVETSFAARPDGHRDSGCDKLLQPRFDISKKSFDDAGKAVTQTIHENRVDLHFAYVVDLVGTHAYCVESLRGDLIHIRRGGDYQLTSAGYLKRHIGPRFPPSSPYAVRPEQTGPLLNGRRPSSVAALGFPPFGPERVGVWTDPGGSSIALFGTGADVGTPPRVVGTTTARLRGISYFPAPDAPTGTITVIRDIAPDHVEIWVGELRTKPFVR